MHSTHHDWRGDLSVSRSHIGYSIQGYTCRSCFSPHQFGVAMSSEDNGSWGYNYVESTFGVGGIIGGCSKYV